MNITKINHALTHLPLEQAKGSAQQRLDKVAKTSRNFMGNIEALYDSFGNITPKTYKQVLTQTAKAPNIQVEIGENPGLKTGKLTYTIGYDNNSIKGYTLFVPTGESCYTECSTIPKTAAPVFMKLAYSFYNKIFNPKVIQRAFAMNKYDSKTISEFYNKNIEGLNKFTKEELHKFLENRPSQEKIDILQFFRYNMTEQLNANRMANECKARFDRKFRTKTINRFPAFKIKEHCFPAKIKLVEAELAQTLKEERANLTNLDSMI